MCCRQCQDIESIAPEEIRSICLKSVLVATVLSDTAPAAAELILESERFWTFSPTTDTRMNLPVIVSSLSVYGEASHSHLEPQCPPHCPPRPSVPSRQASMRLYQRSSYPIMKTLVRITCSLYFRFLTLTRFVQTSKH